MRGRINFVGAFGYLTDVETNELLGKFVDESVRKNARDGAVVECEIEPARWDVALDRKFMDGVPLHSQDQIKAVPSLRVVRVLEMQPCFAVKVQLSLSNFDRTRLGTRQSAGIELTATNNTHLCVDWEDPNTDPSLLKELKDVFQTGCEFRQAQLHESEFEVDIPGDQHEGLLEGGVHRATRLVQLRRVSNKRELLKKAVSKEIMRHQMLFDRSPWKGIACRPNLTKTLAQLCKQCPQAPNLPWIAVDNSRRSNAEGIFALTDTHLFLAVACPAPLLAGEPEITREVIRRKLSLYIDVQANTTACDPQQQAMMPPDMIELCGLSGKGDTLAMVYPIRRPRGHQRDFEDEPPFVAVISKDCVQQLTFSDFEHDRRLPAFVDLANQLAEARVSKSTRLGLQHVTTFPAVQLEYNEENEAKGLVEIQSPKAFTVVEEFSLHVALVTGRLLREHRMPALVSQQPPLPPTTLENLAARVPGVPSTLQGMVQHNRELAARDNLTDQEIIQAEWMKHLLGPSSCTVANPARIDLDIGHFTHGAHFLAPASRTLRNAHHLYNQAQLLRVVGFKDPLPDLSPLIKLEGLHHMKELACASSVVSKAVQGVQFAIALSKRSFLTKAIVSTVDETGFLLEDFRTHLRCRVTYVSIQHLLQRAPELRSNGVSLSFRYGRLNLEANCTLVPVVIGAIESNGNLSFVVRSVQLEGGHYIPIGHISEFAASLFMDRKNLALPALKDTFRDSKDWATQFYFQAMTDQLHSSLEQAPVSYTQGQVAGNHITAVDVEVYGSCFAIVWGKRARTQSLPTRLGDGTHRITGVEDAYVFARVVKKDQGREIEIHPYPGMSASSSQALKQLNRTAVDVLLVPVVRRDAEVLQWLQALATREIRPARSPQMPQLYHYPEWLQSRLDATDKLFATYPALLQKAPPHVQPPKLPAVRLAQQLCKRFRLKELPPEVTKLIARATGTTTGPGAAKFQLLDVQLRALESMLSEPLTILDGSGGTGKSAVQAFAAALLALCHRAQRTKDPLPALVVSEKNASLLSFAKSSAGLPVRVGWFIAESAQSDQQALPAGAFPKNLTLSTDLARLADCDVLLCTNAQARKISRPVSTVFVDEVTTLQESQLIFTLSVLATQRGTGPLPRLVFSGDLNQSRPYTSSTVSTPFSWLERFDSRHRGGGAPPFYFRFEVNFRTDRAPLIRLQQALGCRTVARSAELEGDINAVLPAIYMWSVDGSDSDTMQPEDLERIAAEGCPFKWNPTSFLNIEEAWGCLALVKELRRPPLNRSDILIVSPYVNQLVLIWHLLRVHGIVDCSLRTCMDTSGGQAEIVIVSFVRTALNAAGEPKGRLDPSHVRTALMRPTSSLFILGSEQWMSRNHRWGTAKLLMVIRQEMQQAGPHPSPPKLNRPYCPPLRPFFPKLLTVTKRAELDTVTPPRVNMISLTNALRVGPTTRLGSGHVHDEALAEPEPVFELPPPTICA